MLLGICIGGRGSRMGGVQKALLRAPDTGETLIDRTLRLARETGYEAVLLGAAELGDSARGVQQLPDAMPELGPLSGLASLLAHAGDRAAVCLACDMPYLTAPLLSRLAREHAEASVLAARDPASGKWQALCARYRSEEVLPILQAAFAAGERSFQGLFRRLTVAELALNQAENAQLRDWDTPEDVH
jgi:molybdopterin-guanine dinucleotide biosynthesis protein A